MIAKRLLVVVAILAVLALVGTKSASANPPSYLGEGRYVAVNGPLTGVRTKLGCNSGPIHQSYDCSSTAPRPDQQFRLRASVESGMDFDVPADLYVTAGKMRVYVQELGWQWRHFIIYDNTVGGQNEQVMWLGGADPFSKDTYDIQYLPVCPGTGQPCVKVELTAYNLNNGYPSARYLYNWPTAEFRRVRAGVDVRSTKPLDPATFYMNAEFLLNTYYDIAGGPHTYDASMGFIELPLRWGPVWSNNWAVLSN
jgi:hypothetical protein